MLPPEQDIASRRGRINDVFSQKQCDRQDPTSLARFEIDRAKYYGADHIGSDEFSYLGKEYRSCHLSQWHFIGCRWAFNHPGSQRLDSWPAIDDRSSSVIGSFGTPWAALESTKTTLDPSA
jgi:hypothetical protein